MCNKLRFLLKPQTWLFALLLIMSALPAQAQYEDWPFRYEEAQDGSGYIIYPLQDFTYDNELFVPAVRESDGRPIVGVDGFSYKERIMAIFFEDGSQVKYIGSFEGCRGLQSIVNLPASVETIGDYAFQGCEMLRDVTLNSGLKYLGISCFEGCESLDSITLPKSLKVIRENAFRVCTALKTVVFEDSVNFYDGYSYGFYNNVFDGCENLSSVTLPKNSPGNFTIPMGTFAWCSSLKSIEFPANTTRIDQSAFYRSGLESLDFTTITSEKVYIEGYYTFAACENLKSVKANGNLQFGSASLYTFQDCKALETFTIGGSGDDFITITPDAFRNCEKLHTFEVYRLRGSGEINEMDSVFVGCKSLKEFAPTHCELNKIGYSCFSGCESLENVNITQEKPLRINDEAFKGCTALQNLVFSDLTAIDSPAIGSKAFTGCSSLASITFTSETPPTVSNDSFEETHYSNTVIAVPDERYSVYAADAFWSQFQRLKHPSLFAYSEVPGGYSVTKSQYALDADFHDMLVIPAEYNSGAVVAIAEGAFQDFTALTGVTLPEGLTSIGANAFAGCTNIKTVINKCPEPIYGDGCPETIFDNKVYQSGTLYVPFGSLDIYSQFAPWANFTSGRIRQGIGEREFSSPEASPESCEFNYSFDLTLTAPYYNDEAKVYYYIITEDDDPHGVHPVYTYSVPIKIKESCKVVAYISDGTSCSEPVSYEYTYVHLPSEVFDCTSMEQGTQDKAFTTENPGPLFNQVIDNVYYSITDATSGCSATDGLVLNATSSIDDVYEFNSAVESKVDPTCDFNGIALKVQGVGSITFTGAVNNGNARLTLVLGNGPAVYVDELVDGKYEFSLPAAKYLYIFATQTAPLTAPQLKAPVLGENGVTLKGIALSISDLYISTVTGLDKVLSANVNDSYRINTPLYGRYFDGTYLYASTMDNNGSSKNTFNADKKDESGSDNESAFKQEDWVAISNMSADFVGKVIESGTVATVHDNSAYPVITFAEAVTSADGSSIVINSFRVENFNIHAESAAVNNIWLAAPQPAEYCTVLGFVRTENIHDSESYIVLLSEEYTKIAEDGTGIEPLTMNVHYSDPAIATTVGTMAWYEFTGIVYKDGDTLTFKALKAKYKLPSAIESVDAAGSAQLFTSAGHIHVACEAPTAISVYSVTGQLVAAVEAADATIAVSPGLYIVKVGNQATKLSVK